MNDKDLTEEEKLDIVREIHEADAVHEENWKSLLSF